MKRKRSKTQVYDFTVRTWTGSPFTLHSGKETAENSLANFLALWKASSSIFQSNDLWGFHRILETLWETCTQWKRQAFSWKHGVYLRKEPLVMEQTALPICRLLSYQLSKNLHLKHLTAPHNHLLFLFPASLPTWVSTWEEKAQMAGVGVPKRQILFCLFELHSLLKQPQGTNKTYY